MRLMCRSPRGQQLALQLLLLHPQIWVDLGKRDDIPKGQLSHSKKCHRGKAEVLFCSPVQGDMESGKSSLPIGAVLDLARQ